jgi:glycosyltransferase involved in cell wall biosynthesis
MAGLDARVVVVGFGPERGALEAQAAELGVDALFTGPLEHRHLRHLLALADACVVPSVFPEAFGMVAAEAAAAGCPPLVARHSGLAEVAADLEAALPASLHETVAFPRGDAAALRRSLAALLALPDADRQLLRRVVRSVAEEQWSWAGIAARLARLATTAA